MRDRARAALLKAQDEGWRGPPFDPIILAEKLGITVVPRDEIAEARTLPVGSGKLQIEYNPNKPKARIRFSVAHEIAHTFFDDCAERIRHRLQKHELHETEWQIEVLCNFGAAEILMPYGSFPELGEEANSIDDLMSLRVRYEVSAEAVMMRFVRLTTKPCLMFVASRHEEAPNKDRYQVDYAIPSRSWGTTVTTGSLLPSNTVIRECTAIGFTAKGEESWTSGDVARVECVGIPPYPNHVFPRVVGLLFGRRAETEPQGITYLKGDATEPRGSGPRLIAHVVNDRTPRWGAGFALGVRKKWPSVQNEFISWVEAAPARLKLGNVFCDDIANDISICHMICQHGYGDSPTPRIRYGALERCLHLLADKAIAARASVHMPKIGSGQAGGSWPLISEMVDDIVCRRGVPVTVYSLPVQPESFEAKQQVQLSLKHA